MSRPLTLPAAIVMLFLLAVPVSARGPLTAQADALAFVTLVTVALIGLTTVLVRARQRHTYAIAATLILVLAAAARQPWMTA